MELNHATVNVNGMNKSHAECKRKQREKKRANGYVLKQIWVKPEKWAEIKRIIDNGK